MRVVEWNGNTRITKETFYPFSELSESAQREAWERHWLNDGHYPWDDENRASLYAFCDMFGVEPTSWEYGYYCYISYQIFDTWWTLYSLKGVRLWKYLINNGYDKTIKKTCPLTGGYWDEDLLEPLREFLRRPDTDTTMKDLVHKSLWAWVRGCQEDYEYYFSFEYFSQEAIGLGWRFTFDGREWVCL